MTKYPSDRAARNRSAVLVSFGCVLFAISCIVFYANYRSGFSPVKSESDYAYTVKQNLDTKINYLDSSFFDSQPNPENTGYITSLTSSIIARYSYNFSGSQPIPVTTRFTTKASVQANYSLKGSSEQSANIWSKQFTIEAPSEASSKNGTVSGNFDIPIPFEEYRSAAEDFRNSLSLPTNSQLVVTITALSTGIYKDNPISDSRVSTITIPLDQQLYKPELKIDKSDSNVVLSKKEAQSSIVKTRLLLIGSTLAALGGIGLVVYGLRTRIFKSPYRRELDKIYRYHDSIIVRTSRAIDMSDMTVVSMRSFDDMLNLEEELKAPIIADELSSTATQFSVVSNNVVYRYTLSDEQTSRSSLAEKMTRQTITTEHRQPLPSRADHQPIVDIAGPVRRRKQTSISTESLDDIVRELETKKTHTPQSHHSSHKKKTD